MSALILILWVGLSIYIGSAAGKRGRSSGGWFFISLLTSPILAGIFLLIAGDIKSGPTINNIDVYSLIPSIEKDNKICPKCAESIKIAALVCRYCGYEYDPEEAKSILIAREKELSADSPEGRFVSQKGIEGKAFCLGCRITTLRSNLLYNEKKDIFYHPQCLPR